MDFEHPGLIKYSLEKRQTSDGQYFIQFQILEQNLATVCGRGGSSVHYGVTGKRKCTSSYSPDLEVSTVYLRGSGETQDFRISVRHYGSEKQADDDFLEIRKAILAWARLDAFTGLRKGWPELEGMAPTLSQMELWD